MTIIQMLQKLSAIAPEFCKEEGDPGSEVFTIGKYTFWDDDEGEFTAEENGNMNCFIKGSPALAWLQAAIQQVIEAEGWDYSHQKAWGRHQVTIIGLDGFLINANDSDSSNTGAEAFLSCYLRAKETNRERQTQN